MRWLLSIWSLIPIAEPFNDDGTWRSDVFYNTLNTSYVSIALQAARAADPDAKLYINDYNIENSGAKATAMLNLVRQLIADGVPIDGVGFQSHFIVGSVPTSFQTVLEQFTALGLEVAITELDIRMTLPATDALLAQQSRDYQSVVQACMNVDKCVGITIWDYTDKVRLCRDRRGCGDNDRSLIDFRASSILGFPAPSLDRAQLAHGMR